MAMLRSLLSLCFITLNLTLWCVPLVILSLGRVLWPSGKRRFRSALRWIYLTAVRADDWWFESVLGHRMDLPSPQLIPETPSIVIANHRSWVDVLLIQSLMSRSGVIVNFLAKKELAWIPVLGLILWAYEFPLLTRRASDANDDAQRRVDDMRRVADACDLVKESTGAILSFAEGTRFTPEKRVRLQSPYRHLLPPRPGGFEALCLALEPQAGCVVDVTIVHPDPFSFFRFLGGSVRIPQIRVETFPLDEICRIGPRQWLIERWNSKDELITAALLEPLPA